MCDINNPRIEGKEIFNRIVRFSKSDALDEGEIETMLIREIQTNDYVTKSNLPFCDYVINPYIGCVHGCKYCYASFMKRFTGHTEDWGTFLDVKQCDKPISVKKLTGKAVFLSSVTDPYNSYEKKYGITRAILEQLSYIDCTLYISTKSSLILRDIDLLKKQKHLVAAVSLNTLDENFRREMDHGATVESRLGTLRELHENGIYTVLFISPIFPCLTDFRTLIEATRAFIDEFWFENLNLRGNYKAAVLGYIHAKYSQYDELYKTIYQKGDTTFWKEMERDFTAYCTAHSIKYVNAFDHKRLVIEKKQRRTLMQQEGEPVT